MATREPHIFNENAIALNELYTKLGTSVFNHGALTDQLAALEQEIHSITEQIKKLKA